MAFVLANPQDYQCALKFFYSLSLHDDLYEKKRRLSAIVGESALFSYLVIVILYY